MKQINLQNCQLSKKKRSVSTVELEFGMLTKSESNVTTGSMLLVRTTQDLFGIWPWHHNDTMLTSSNAFVACSTTCAMLII